MRRKREAAESYHGQEMLLFGRVCEEVVARPSHETRQKRGHRHGQCCGVRIGVAPGADSLDLSLLERGRPRVGGTRALVLRRANTLRGLCTAASAFCDRTSGREEASRAKEKD